MDKSYKEKRNSPRVKADLELKLPKGFEAESIDFSEGGLKLNSKETISSPMVSLSIKFPDKKTEFKAKAQLVWQRDTGLGDSIYGIKFVNLKDSQKKALREELIENQLKSVLEEIKDEETKGYILKFFSSDILDYINEITEVTEHQGEETKYSQELEKKLEHLNNKILLKGYCLELLLTDKAVLQKVKENFRDLVGVWVYKSAIVKRAFEKPTGYPEDYRMLELIYENLPISKNVGLYFDNIFLKSPYSVSIRNRKNHLSRKIIDFVNNSQLNLSNILSVCSGTGHEIADAIPLFNPSKKVNFTCVETDEKALDFSRDVLSQSVNDNIRFDFKHEAIFRILEADKLINKYDKQNLIYTLGIIDYLSDRAAKRIIKILYSLLEKGGMLILSHRDRDKTFPPIPPDWLCDWKVIARNEEEMSKLFYEVGIPNVALSTESDNFGYIHYFTLTKK